MKYAQLYISVTRAFFSAKRMIRVKYGHDLMMDIRYHNIKTSVVTNARRCKWKGVTLRVNCNLGID